MNPDFDYRDINTLGNSWIRFKGKLWNGMREGICYIYLVDGSKLYINFKNDMANGKGVYINGDKRISGVWKENFYVDEHH